MFELHTLISGGDVSNTLDFNSGNTLLLAFLLIVGVMFVIRYRSLRKWGIKVIFAIIMVYGGYNLGLYIGVEVLHSINYWNIFAILGILVGLGTFLYSTKVINDKFK